MHLTVLLPSLINRGYTQVYEIIFTQHPPDIGTLGNKSCLNLARFQSAAKQVCVGAVGSNVLYALLLQSASFSSDLSPQSFRPLHLQASLVYSLV